MYCSNCKCEFVDWIRKCPNCKHPLVEDIPSDTGSGDKTISYGELVELVRENNGQLQVELSTTNVGRQKKWSFPYFAYGYAWAKSMQGAYKDIQVELSTSEVGKRRQLRFPYLGYGYAWAKSMGGYIGGNEVSLSANKVTREKKWIFPYFGFGRAWTQKMSGECGDQINLDISITENGSSREWGGFPFLFRGYGFAWEKQGVLTLTLNE